MWQAVIVGLLVAAGVAILIYRAYCALTGKGGCGKTCPRGTSTPGEGNDGCREDDG